MTMNTPSVFDLAQMIDHSLLHPTMTDADLRAGCLLARRYRCGTVCIKPYAVIMAKVLLAGSDTRVCTVIGFPHGNSVTGIKIAEAERAIADGAVEVDMVVNIGDVLSGKWAAVEREIHALNALVTALGATLKVIFENDYLTNQHIVTLCEICSRIQVAFVKTSSGYGFVKQADGNYNYKGATREHLVLMRQHCPATVQVKAAGGVRTLDDLLMVRELGVTRIGATATAAMIDAAIARNLPGSVGFFCETAPFPAAPAAPAAPAVPAVPAVNGTFAGGY